MPARRLAILASLSLLCSGGAGLVYQIAWQRYLARLIGVDAVATATVLAVFLSGLSLGYALCGAWSARARRPLGIYILIEVAIGIWGGVFLAIFPAVERMAGRIDPGSPVSLALTGIAAASVLILPPTLLMGAAVPFMTRVLVARDRSATGTVAWVYGVNTAGAVAGTLAAAFLLMPRIGPQRTVLAGAALNLIAAGLLVLATPRSRDAGAADRAESGTPPIAPRFGPRALGLFALMSGFLVMSQEAAMIRFASLVFGGMTYVFGLVVAVFVLGIAAGSLAVARLRSIAPASLGAAFCASAGLWLIVFLSLDHWPWWAHLIRVGVQGNAAGFVLYYALVFLFLCLFLLPVVAPMGSVLPLLFAESGDRDRAAGRSAGMLLSWNAVGALAGSLGGGLLLFHLLDLGRILLVGPLVAAIAGAAALRWQPPPWRWGSIGLVAACLVFVAAAPGHDATRLTMGTYRLRQPVAASFEGAARFHADDLETRRLLLQEDGPLVSVAVLEAPALVVPGVSPLSLFINGKSDSNTAADRITLKLMAHLPALAAPGARSALVVGLGTGVTAGELPLYEDLQRIDVAEISPTVVRALPLFGWWTRDVHDDPRLRILARDGRLVLRSVPGTWDLIVSEPSHVWVSGMDLLFTREFFGSARDRLGPQGVFLQWLQLYEANCEMAYIILNTLQETFPHLRAFHGSQGDLLILAADGPIALDAEGVRARLLAHPEVAASLAEAGVESAESLMGREVTILPEILRRARSHPVHTLDGARLLYLSGRGMFEGRTVQVPELAGIDAELACGPI